MTRDLTWIFLAICAIATLAASFSRNRMPVVGSIVIAGVLRIAFAALTSERYTPHDVRSYFQTTGQLILQGKEPVHNMAGRQWNFLDFMPVIHAIELKTGLAWVYAVKIAPIAADLVLVWLIARFAFKDGRTRALQYAVNPLSLLVVSLHGQVEPVALALALTGILLIKKGRPVLGGVLLGAAVAAKTWPAVILIAVLPLRNLPKLVRIVAGAAIVPVLCLLTGVLLLDMQPLPDLHHILSYSSLVSLWTWSGTYIALGHENLAGYGSPLGPLGTMLVLIGVAVALVLLRKREPHVRALGVLCAVLVCSSGFGVQYLLWVVPLMMALSGPIRIGYVLGAAAWAAVFYLTPIQGAAAAGGYLRGMSWLPFALMLAALIQLVRFRPAAVVLPAEVDEQRSVEPVATEPRFGMAGPESADTSDTENRLPRSDEDSATEQSATGRRGFVESEA